jgi:hypothetical protein
MSRFRIHRIDHYDPIRVGRKYRIIYAVCVLLPLIFMNVIQLMMNLDLNTNEIFLACLPVIVMVYFILLKKVRANAKDMKQIGEIEITQSCLRKWIGDSMTEYSFQFIKELRLTKHLPSTSVKESKGSYFSYILKIILTDSTQESLIVSDRSIDHNNKISLAETMRTLKKIVHFEVNLEL